MLAHSTNLYMTLSQTLIRIASEKSVNEARFIVSFMVSICLVRILQLFSGKGSEGKMDAHGEDEQQVRAAITDGGTNNALCTGHNDRSRWCPLMRGSTVYWTE